MLRSTAVSGTVVRALPYVVGPEVMDESTSTEAQLPPVTEVLNADESDVVVEMGAMATEPGILASAYAVAADVSIVDLRWCLRRKPTRMSSRLVVSSKSSPDGSNATIARSGAGVPSTSGGGGGEPKKSSAAQRSRPCAVSRTRQRAAHLADAALAVRGGDPDVGDGHRGARAIIGDQVAGHEADLGRRLRSAKVDDKRPAGDRAGDSSDGLARGHEASTMLRRLAEELGDVLVIVLLDGVLPSQLGRGSVGGPE